VKRGEPREEKERCQGAETCFKRASKSQNKERSEKMIGAESEQKHQHGKEYRAGCPPVEQMI